MGWTTGDLDLRDRIIVHKFSVLSSRVTRCSLLVEERDVREEIYRRKEKAVFLKKLKQMQMQIYYCIEQKVIVHRRQKRVRQMFVKGRRRRRDEGEKRQKERRAEEEAHRARGMEDGQRPIGRA